MTTKTAKTSTSTKKKAPAQKGVISNTNNDTAAVPFAKLVLSPQNPRQNVNLNGIEALAESINACGLLQNLIGMENKGKVEIIAGGRRLRALQLLVERGDLQDDHLVPVRLATNEQDALQWAQAENEAREDLSPADEIRAYRTMNEKGLTLDQMAAATAKTKRHVMGRLKLANLAEPILEALKTREISLDVAAAYTITDNQDRQIDVFERAKGSWLETNIQRLKSMLTEEALTAGSSLVRFVGREAYEQAKGRISEDLFGEDIYFLDADILKSLADAKLDQIKIDLLAEGWKWVKSTSESSYHVPYGAYENIKPSSNQLSDEEFERYDELAALVENDEASEEELAAFDLLEDKQDPVYSDIQKAHSGVEVYINWQGEIVRYRGLIELEDIEEAVEAGVLEVHQPAKKDVSLDQDKPAYSQALLADMATIRTGAMQTAIMQDDSLVLDIAIFALSSKIFAGSSPFNIHQSTIRPEVEGHGQSLPDELTDSDQFRHMDAKTATEAFRHFRHLSDKMKRAMLAQAVATATETSLNDEKRANPLVEHLATVTKLNPRDTWTPNDAFFKRLTAAQLEDIMTYILGRKPAASFVKKQKKDKVARLHAIFNDEVARRGFSTEEQQRIADWLPDELKTTPTPQEENNTGTALVVVEQSGKQAA